MIPKDWMTPAQGIPRQATQVTLDWGHVVLTLEQRPHPPAARVTDDAGLGSWADTVIRSDDLSSFTRELSRRISVAGVVLDAAFGLSLVSAAIEHARTTWPRLPALVLCEQPDAGLRARIAGLGAGCLDTCPAEHDVAQALVGFFSSVHCARGRHIARIEMLANRCLLTPRETALLALFTLGVRRRDLAARLSVTDNTVKAMVRSILAKVGEERLSDLLHRLATPA